MKCVLPILCLLLLNQLGCKASVDGSSETPAEETPDPCEGFSLENDSGDELEDCVDTTVAEHSDTRPSKSWEKVDGAEKYEAQIANDQSCEDNIQSKTVTEPSVTFDPIKNGEYYLCVDAIDSNGSVIKTFVEPIKVIAPGPGDFSITEPSNPGVAGSQSGAWTASERAVKYITSVGTLDSCSDASTTNETTATTAAIDTLEPGDYKFCVTAFDEADNALGKQVDFQVQFPKPENFEFTHKGYSQSPDPTVRWTKAKGAVKYKVKVGTDASCDTVVQSETTTKAQIKLSNHPVGRYWICVDALSASNLKKKNSMKYIQVPTPLVVGAPKPDMRWNDMAFNTAHDLHTDGTRLFVADTLNHRVLIYNKIPEKSTDAPDFVLGQTTWDTNTSGTAADKFNFPLGMTTAAGKLFVADYLNSRVLAWNIADIDQNGEPATMVLGQDSFTEAHANSNGSGASTIAANNMAAPKGVATDGTKLFVVDTNNNRVLIWNDVNALVSGHVNFAGSAADEFLGAANGTTAGGGAGLDRFAFPSGVSVLSNGDLVVADTSNNRVSVWHTTAPTTNSTADAVITESTGGNSLSSPEEVLLSGDKIIVSDLVNNRVLVYDLSNLTEADVVVGQTNLTDNTANNDTYSGIGCNTYYPSEFTYSTAITPAACSVTSKSLKSPSGLLVHNGDLFIADIGNHRILRYKDFNFSSGHFQAASGVIGKVNFYFDGTNNFGIGPMTLDTPHAAYVHQGKLIVGDTFNDRVLIWNEIPTSNGTSADIVIGQPTFYNDDQVNAASDQPTARTMTESQQIYAYEDYLVLVDKFQSRTLIYTPFPTTSYPEATYVLGQPNMTTGTNDDGGGAANWNSMDDPKVVWGHGPSIFVGDTDNGRVLIWKDITKITAHNTDADIVFGKATETDDATPAGPLQNNIRTARGGYYDGDSKTLFVSDDDYKRIMIWRNFDLSTFTSQTALMRNADNVLGQGAYNTSGGGTTASAVQKLRPMVFVNGDIIAADTNNHRVMRWDDYDFGGHLGQPATSIYGQVDCVSNNAMSTNGLSIKSYNNTRGVWSDGEHIFVSEGANDRILMFLNTDASQKTDC